MSGLCKCFALSWFIGLVSPEQWSLSPHQPQMSQLSASDMRPSQAGETPAGSAPGHTQAPECSNSGVMVAFSPSCSSTALSLLCSWLLRVPGKAAGESPSSPTQQPPVALVLSQSQLGWNGTLQAKTCSWGYFILWLLVEATALLSVSLTKHKILRLRKPKHNSLIKEVLSFLVDTQETSWLPQSTLRFKG